MSELVGQSNICTWPVIICGERATDRPSGRTTNVAPIRSVGRLIPIGLRESVDASGSPRGEAAAE